MDFFELEAFVALGKSLRFSKAALAVNLSASALSRLVVRLEEELGVNLVKRDSRSVSLTEPGLLLLSFAEETLRQRDALHLMLNSTDGELRGTLRVYASVTACYSILPPFAEALSTTHPHLKLSVETGDPADAKKSIAEGRVDLALAALPPNGFSQLECFSVRRTPLVFVTQKAGSYGGLSPERSEQGLVEMVSSNPLILPSRGLARERFDRWTHQSGIRPTIAAEAAGNEAVLALARLGLGLGLVPRLVLENSPFAEGLVVYGEESALGDYDIGFVLPEKTLVSAEGLRNALRSVLEKAYPDGTWFR